MSAEPKLFYKSIEGYAHMPTYILGEEYEGPVYDRAFLIEAQGDGMNLVGIRNGDKLFVDTELEPLNGDVVIATVEGQEVCRRFLQIDGKTYFRREDGITPDVSTEDYTIHGVVAGVMSMHRFAFE